MQHFLSALERRIERVEKPSYTAMALILCCFALAILWLNEFPPLQDYPYHLVRFHLIVNYWSNEYNYSEIASLSLFPTPYILVDYIVLLLGQFFSIETSGKIVLSIYVLLVPISLFYLVSSWNSKNLVIGFFGFLLIFNWFFAMGFVNFILAIPLALVALGYWWKHQEHSSIKTRAVLAFLLLLVYSAHLIIFCLLLAVLAVLLVLRRMRGTASLNDAWAAAPTLVLLLVVFARDLPSSGEVEGLFALIYSGLAEKLAYAFQDRIPYLTSYRIRSEYRLLTVAALLIALLVGRQVFQREPLEKEAVLVILMLFLMYLAIPEQFLLPKLGYVSPRVLIFLVPIAFLLINAPTAALPRFGLALSVFCVSLALFASVFGSFQEQGKHLSDLKDAIQRIPEGKKISSRIDLGMARYGRIRAAAGSDGYYYISRAGNAIPAIPSFGGPLRALQFRDMSERTSQIQKAFGRQCSERRQTRYIVLLGGQSGWADSPYQLSDDCREIWAGNWIAVYQATSVGGKPKGVSRPRRVNETGFKDSYEYLLVLAPPDLLEELEENHELIYSKGDVTLWHLR